MHEFHVQPKRLDRRRAPYVWEKVVMGALRNTDLCRAHGQPTFDSALIFFLAGDAVVVAEAEAAHLRRTKHLRLLV